MAAPKVVNCLVYRMTLGVRMIQHAYRCHLARPRLATFPRELKFRQLYMQNLKGTDLRESWIRMNIKKQGGSADSTFAGGSSPAVPDVQLAYLRILLSLVTDEFNATVKKDRMRVVRSGGLVPLVSMMKSRAESPQGELAMLIVLQLAKEPLLLQPLLVSGAVGPLRAKLVPSGQTFEVCMALDTLDVMAHNAMRISDINKDRVRGGSDSSDEEDWAAAAAAGGGGGGGGSTNDDDPYGDGGGADEEGPTSDVSSIFRKPEQLRALEADLVEFLSRYS
jgi:hypothetical protein